MAPSSPSIPLIPANAGTQMASAQAGSMSAAQAHLTSKPFDLGPGIRRDERGF